MITYPKGTVMECTTCGVPFAKLLVGVTSADIMRREQVEPLAGFTEGKDLVCANCNAQFLRDRRFNKIINFRYVVPEGDE